MKSTTQEKSQGEVRYTPGPWTIHDNIGRKSEMGIMANGAPCIIAIMGNAKAWPVEAHANARLIAAAPDLLEACKVALSEAKIDQDSLQCALAALTSIRGTLAAAITKATNHMKEGAK